jgi:hypothetical protein
MWTANGWRSFLLLGAAAAGICAALAGCSDLVGPVTGKAVGASLEAVNERANRERIEELLTSEAVVRSTRKLTQAVIDAALADLDSDEREARKQQLTAEFVRDLGPILGAMLDKDILPRVQSRLEASVQAVLDQALSEANRRRAGDFAAGVARQALDAVGPRVARSLSDGVSSGIERSIRAVLARDLAPALGKALDASAPAVSRVMRAGTAGALQGVADAMNGPFGEMFRRERDSTFALAQQAAAAERRAWLEELHKQLDESRRWFHTLVIMAAAAGLLLLGIGVLLWRLVGENRRLRSGARAGGGI